MAYSFTGDGDPIFIHLSILSLFHLHLIQQSLLIIHAQAAHEENILPSNKYKQYLATIGISKKCKPSFWTLFCSFVATLIFDRV